MIRQYRIDLTTKGQHSPLVLNKPVCEVINRLNIPADASVIDIGCGMGEHAKLIKEKFPSFRMVGVDFSPATVAYLQKGSVYDAVHLCSSSTLPLATRSGTVSLSMENLEHLYYEDVVNALSEQKRVADYMIITTPLPSEVMNIQWLSREIPDAIRDDIPLTPHDYTCLESAVHKSIVYPHSMGRCGFKMAWTGMSMVYFARSDAIDLQHLEFDGIRRTEFEARNFQTLKEKYVALLKECLKINGDILVKYLENKVV
jgi:SAM-dependent methyltransferase